MNAYWRRAPQGPRHLLVILVATCGLRLSAWDRIAGYEPAELHEYHRAPDAIEAVLDSNLQPEIRVSPTGDRVLGVQFERYVPLQELAKRTALIAGMRIDLTAAKQFDPFYIRSLTLYPVNGGANRSIALPSGMKSARPSPLWSADGRMLMLTNVSSDGSRLWIVDCASGEFRSINGVARLNGILGTAAQWMPDQRHVLLKAATSSVTRLEELLQPSPPHPQISDTATTELLFRPPTADGQTELFQEEATTAQLTLVDTLTDEIRNIGVPGSYELVRPSPDGAFLLVVRVLPPLAATSSVAGLGKDVEVWNLRSGSTRRIARIPTSKPGSTDGDSQPHDFQWKPNAGATLAWIEGASDAGEAAGQRVMALEAPFDGSAVEVIRTPYQYRRLEWGDSDRLLIATEYDRKRRWVRLTAVASARPRQTRTIWEGNVDDKYHWPGSPLTRTTSRGTKVLQSDGDNLFFVGIGESPTGNRPFLDLRNWRTTVSIRLFQSSTTEYELPVDLIGTPPTTLLMTRQTVTAPPNVYVRPLRYTSPSPAPARAVTQLVDDAPALRRIKKQLVTYRRRDGVLCSFTYYLPPDYTPGTRLPTLLWTYPAEFVNVDTASQLTSSDRQFEPMLSASHLYLALAGYAVLDNVTSPIIADPDKITDTYLSQITWSAEAAVEQAVALGFADPKRIAIGGHSYGAFTAVNLLVHTRLFRAGIARSGTYNRTLTPFGFQNERRTLWQAKELYINVSPFMFADKLTAPLLLIHGLADTNPATPPTQSERLYEAVSRNGGTARLVLLPLEAHGYAARESVADVLYEMANWLSVHLRPEGPPR